MIHGETIINPLVIWILVIAIIFVFVLPRQKVCIPIICLGIFISMQQRIVIASLDFTIIRFLMLIAIARIIIRSEYHETRLNSIDKIFICWAIVRVITYTLLWKTSGAFINRLGGSFDALAIYFIIRSTIRNLDDIHLVLKTFLITCVPLGILMLIEWTAGRNYFSIFGGVPEFTYVRDGRLRCQGAFQHPISAGSYAASLFPFIVYYGWKDGGKKTISFFLGAVAILIIAASSSSGPVITFIAAVSALFLWPFRNNMKKIVLISSLCMVGLHLVMKAPVWAIVMRVGVFGSSTGYHRYHLLDNFIRRVNEWWLWGTQSTAHWGHHMWDVTNNFVRIGIDGGFLTLLLFILIIVFCFKSINQIIINPAINLENKKLLWILGVALFTHVVTFMGIAYRDQIIYQYYILVALISTIINLYTHPETNVLSEV